MCCCDYQPHIATHVHALFGTRISDKPRSSIKHTHTHTHTQTQTRGRWCAGGAVHCELQSVVVCRRTHSTATAMECTLFVGVRQHCNSSSVQNRMQVLRARIWLFDQTGSWIALRAQRTVLSMRYGRCGIASSNVLSRFGASSATQRTLCVRAVGGVRRHRCSSKG